MRDAIARHGAAGTQPKARDCPPVERGAPTPATRLLPLARGGDGDGACLIEPSRSLQPLRVLSVLSGTRTYLTKSVRRQSVPELPLSRAEAVRQCSPARGGARTCTSREDCTSVPDTRVVSMLERSSCLRRRSAASRRQRRRRLQQHRRRARALPRRHRDEHARCADRSVADFTWAADLPSRGGCPKASGCRAAPGRAGRSTSCSDRARASSSASSVSASSDSARGPICRRKPGGDASPTFPPRALWRITLDLMPVGRSASVRSRGLGSIDTDEHVELSTGDRRGGAGLGAAAASVAGAALDVYEHEPAFIRLLRSRTSCWCRILAAARPKRGPPWRSRPSNVVAVLTAPPCRCTEVAGDSASRPRRMSRRSCARSRGPSTASSCRRSRRSRRARKRIRFRC